MSSALAWTEHLPTFTALVGVLSSEPLHCASFRPNASAGEMGDAGHALYFLLGPTDGGSAPGPGTYALGGQASMLEFQGTTLSAISGDGSIILTSVTNQDVTGSFTAQFGPEDGGTPTRSGTFDARNCGTL